MKSAIALPMLLAALMLAGCAASGEKVISLNQGQTGWVAYTSSREPVELVGRLDIPSETKGRVPVMIIAHASGGLDARSERWAQFFRSQGMATFVIDYFGPRGVVKDSKFQPTPVHDALDAMRLLATHPRVDPARIGVIGFSRGGNLALGAANLKPESGVPSLAAHVALYPACAVSSINRGGSNAPVLILAGEKDDHVPSVQCEVLAQRGRDNGRDVTLKVYEGACHGWDGDFNGTTYHKAVKSTYSMCTSKSITEQSLQDVMVFLRNAMKF